MLKKSKRFIFLLGLYKVSSNLGRVSYELYNQFQNQPVDITNIYNNNNNWSVSTGSSDGIGKALAREFSNYGINPILIARNKEKLQQVQQEFEQQIPNIQTDSIQCDFQNVKLEDYQQIKQQLKEKDISILINNVGCSLDSGKYFFDREYKGIQDMINVNLRSQVMFSKIMLEQWSKQRKKQKSLIINISSVCSEYERLYGSTMYFATKKFNKEFSKIRTKNTEILCIKPGYISTKLNRNMKLSWKCCSLDEEVKIIINCVNKFRFTYGHYKHCLFMFGVNCMPSLLAFQFECWLLNIKGKEKK